MGCSFIFVCLSVHLSVCSFVCLSLCLSLCLLESGVMCMYVYLLTWVLTLVCLYICLSICLSVCHLLDVSSLSDGQSFSASVLLSLLVSLPIYRSVSIYNACLPVTLPAQYSVCLSYSVKFPLLLRENVILFSQMSNLVSWSPKTSLSKIKGKAWRWRTWWGVTIYNNHSECKL